MPGLLRGSRLKALSHGGPVFPEVRIAELGAETRRLRAANEQLRWEREDELAQEDGLEEVAVRFAPWGQEIVSLTFAGNDRGALRPHPVPVHPYEDRPSRQ